MQRVLFLLCIAGVIYTSYLGIRDTHGIQDIQRDSIDVSVIYENEVQIYTLEPYATMDELLERIDINESMDLSKLNRSKILAHRDVITISKYKETPLISINSATLEELMELNGVGPSLAQQIIDYRENVRSFQDLEDLKNVKGFGDKKFDGVKDFICL